MLQKRYSIPLIAGLAALAIAGGVSAALAAPSPTPAATSTVSPSTATSTPDVPVAAPATNGPVATGKPDLASISDGKPPTPDQVLSLIKGNAIEFPQLTASYVKITTLGDLSQVLQALPGGYTPDQKVIVATGIGAFVPQFGRDGQKMTWGAIMVDADTGGMIGSFSQPGDVPTALLP
ncbi:hypothetical protein [Subtercola vilae]|uniref:Uncharacterized protein n=1 Tax=Subtercola vilae TaxID=2056433 RepID=A0A4T2B6W9_9MICO|nr:hypothetical protein [Subtercola vilae]TIH26675.1 hypothetical protein D4765_18890 [Subtercola vilae]